MYKKLISLLLLIFFKGILICQTQDTSQNFLEKGNGFAIVQMERVKEKDGGEDSYSSGPSYSSKWVATYSNFRKENLSEKFKLIDHFVKGDNTSQILVILKYMDSIGFSLMSNAPLITLNSSSYIFMKRKE
jgi:hypothetical protein